MTGPIRIKDLYKRFHNHEVLKGLSLDVMEGETVVILGRSGVGKSVLLRHIMGLEKPDRGVIEINGVNIAALSHHQLYSSIQEMGMLFQNGALFDSMTLFENTAFYLRQHGDRTKATSPLDEKEIRERVHRSLAMVGLSGTEELMPSDLSGGMRKRAALARLIVYRPKIILYDEPTAGLDPITAQQINDLILRTQRELKATSIVVTHDLTVANQVADRIALNHDGKIAYIAEKANFFEIEDPIIKQYLMD